MRPLTEGTVLALHALQLMMLKQGPVTHRDISRSSGFPADRIRWVVARLRKAGLVQSLPGRGFALRKAPGEITVHELVLAIEEPAPPTAPCGGAYDACASRGSCILAPLCRITAESAQQALKSFTLAELLGVRPDMPNCMDPDLQQPRAS
jgi:Rrf2 family protein